MTVLCLGFSHKGSRYKNLNVEYCTVRISDFSCRQLSEAMEVFSLSKYVEFIVQEDTVHAWAVFMKQWMSYSTMGFYLTESGQ